jgi:hypothetical protein
MNTDSNFIMFETGEINEKLLILGVTVLYADEAQSFFFKNEGYTNVSSGISGWFGGSSSSEEIVENAPEENFIRTRGRHNDR